MNVESPIKRRLTRKIYVGDVPVGGDAPISVQSMTNTETCDVAATVAQVRAIADAGADIVRISVPSMDAAEAFREIRAQVTVAQEKREPRVVGDGRHLRRRHFARWWRVWGTLAR